MARIEAFAIRFLALILKRRPRVHHDSAFYYGDGGSGRAHVNVELCANIAEHDVACPHFERSHSVVSDIEQHLTLDESDESPILAQIDFDFRRRIERDSRPISEQDRALFADCRLELLRSL